MDTYIAVISSGFILSSDPPFEKSVRVPEAKVPPPRTLLLLFGGAPCLVFERIGAEVELTTAEVAPSFPNKTFEASFNPFLQLKNLESNRFINFSELLVQ